MRTVNKHINLSRLWHSLQKSNSAALCLFCILLLHVAIPKKASAQEINFGSYADYQIELHDVTMGDLEFEGPIVRNGGIYEVELSDAYILEIIGVKYLDVGVLIEGISDERERCLFAVGKDEDAWYFDLCFARIM